MKSANSADCGHVNQHSKPYTNCYSQPTQFELSIRLVVNPVKHYEEYEDTLWSKEEMLLFLERYFCDPKDFKEISSHLPHKTMTQLIQFYYDFKEFFSLKRYTQYIYTRKKDRRVDMVSVVREVCYLFKD